MDFKEEIKKLLRPAISSDELLDAITSDEAIERNFKRVFTIGNSIYDAASKDAKFDYEVLEKLGDAFLKAIFIQYLYEIIGGVTNTPKTFANMEKVLLDTDHLSDLADKLNFERFSNFDHPRKTVRATKEDMFEAFVGAIAVSGNEFISPGMGYIVAKDWIYSVFDTHMRDKMDFTDPGKYVDYRSQISEFWKLNNWGPVEFSENLRDQSCGSKQTSYNIIGPKVKSFPRELQGKIIGSGLGDNKKEAKENAAKNAVTSLTTLKYKELDVEYDSRNIDRLQKLLDFDPELLGRVMSLIQKPENRISSLSLKKSQIRGNYFAQSIVRFNQGDYQPMARVHSTISMNDAISKAFNGGIKLLTEKYELNP